MSSSEFLTVYGFGVTLGNLYIDSPGYVPVLLENLDGLSRSRVALGWCLVSVLVWRHLNELSSINVPWSQEFSGVLRFWA